MFAVRFQPIFDNLPRHSSDYALVICSSSAAFATGVETNCCHEGRAAAGSRSRNFSVGFKRFKES